MFGCGAFALPTSEVSESKIFYVLVCSTDAIPGTEEGRWLSYRSANKHLLVCSTYHSFQRVVFQISTYTASRSKAATDCTGRGFVLASFCQKADASFTARVIASLHSMGWSSSLAYWTAAELQQYRAAVYGRYGYDAKCRLTWPGAPSDERIELNCNELKRSVLGRPATNGTWSYDAAEDRDLNHFVCEMTL